jgi:hypothetical protein
VKSDGAGGFTIRPLNEELLRLHRERRDLDPARSIVDLFGRGVEKIVSISTGIASAAFTHAAGEPAHFDSRVWIGTSTTDVVDYFS